MTFLDTWDAVPPMWKVILKKNLIFQTELMAIQRSQSKFAARYYDMETYWRVFFGGREIDLDITKDEFEQIQRLEKINCDGTQVEDLAILRDLGLDALKTIDCSRTAIGRIDELAGLERLAILAFEYTRVSDLLSLHDSGTLRKLYFSHTAVSDLGVLERLPLLTNLDFNATEVSDLSPLESCPNLETVVMNGCIKVSELGGLTSTTELFKLDITGTGLTSIDGLAGHSKLRVLLAGNLSLDGIDVVGNLPVLESLYLNNARHQLDLACLESCPSLKALYIGGTLVRNSEVLLEMPSLTMLFHDGLPEDFCAQLSRANPRCSIVFQ